MKHVWTLKFISNVGTPIEMECDKVGLRHLDAARVTLGSPIMCVLAPPRLYSNIAVKLSEEQARASGLFQETDYVMVEVPCQSLNRYVHTSYRVGNDPENAIATYEPDKARIVSDWIRAGHPKKWELD